MKIINVFKIRVNRFLKLVKIKPDRVEDPIKVLEQNLIDVQADLVSLRQAVARQIASTKRIEQEYNKSRQEANAWQQRVDLARKKGDDDLVQEALERKKTFQDTADSMNNSLAEQEHLTNKLKRGLISYESKVAEAKLKMDSFKARFNYIQSAIKIEKNLSLTNSLRLGEISNMGEIESIFNDINIEDNRPS